MLLYTIAFQGGWHLALADTNCIDACTIHSLKCSEEEFHRRNVDIDSSDEVLSIIGKLGGTTSASSCSGAYGLNPSVPNYIPTHCYNSGSTRSLSSFDCGENPYPKNQNKRRICWCHPAGKFNVL